MENDTDTRCYCSEQAREHQSLFCLSDLKTSNDVAALFSKAMYGTGTFSFPILGVGTLGRRATRGAAHHQPAGRRALLVTNLQQNLPSAQRAGEKLRKALPAAGWLLDARDRTLRQGDSFLR